MNHSPSDQHTAELRAAFEAYAKDHSWPLGRNSYNRHLYASDATQYGWWGWKAAIESQAPRIAELESEHSILQGVHAETLRLLEPPPSSREPPHCSTCECGMTEEAQAISRGGTPPTGPRWPESVHVAGGAWLIVFDDQDVKPEMFSGHGAESAARIRFEQISGNWNAHLFARVATNSRDSIETAGVVSQSDCDEIAGILRRDNETGGGQ